MLKRILGISLTAVAVSGFSIAVALAQSRQASRTSQKSAAKSAEKSRGKGNSADLASHLKDVQKQATSIYYAANSDDWSTAENQFSALQKSAAGAEDAAKSDPGSGHLESCIYRLEAELTRRDRLGAMRTSNEITAVVTALAKATHPKAPADVSKLNYLGRELLADADAYQLDQALFVSKEMKKSWDTARQQVTGPGSQSQATALDKALQQVESAKDVAEYRRAAQAELKAAAKVAGLYGQTEITQAPSNAKSKKSSNALSELNSGDHLNQTPVDGAAEPLNNDRNKVGP